MINDQYIAFLGGLVFHFWPLERDLEQISFVSFPSNILSSLSSITIIIKLIYSDQLKLRQNKDWPLKKKIWIVTGRVSTV